MSLIENFYLAFVEGYNFYIATFASGENNVIFVFYLLVLMFGLVFGSFMGCALYRVPRKISLIKPASHCPACKHELGIFSLVPVFSYILSGGKCRYCKAPFSGRYMIVELLSAAVASATVFVFLQLLDSCDYLMALTTLQLFTSLVFAVLLALFCLFLLLLWFFECKAKL